MTLLDVPVRSIEVGRKTVAAAATAEALVASPTACAWVIITAETDNTNPVTWGGENVVGALATREGTPLSAGDSAVIPVDDVSKVYIDVVTSGEGVTFTYGVV